MSKLPKVTPRYKADMTEAEYDTISTDAQDLAEAIDAYKTKGLVIPAALRPVMDNYSDMNEEDEQDILRVWRSPLRVFKGGVE